MARALVDWEINRRRGVDFPLLPLGAAIPPEEDAISVDAAGAFAQDDWAEGRGMAALLEAVVTLLRTVRQQRH